MMRGTPWFKPPAKAKSAITFALRPRSQGSRRHPRNDGRHVCANMCRPRLTFWECAKLGAHTAVAIASRRFPVSASTLRSGPSNVSTTDPPQFPEPGLDRLVADNCEGLPRTDVAFVVVPTPSDETGGFSIPHLPERSSSVSRSVVDDDDLPRVVIGWSSRGVRRHGVQSDRRVVAAKNPHHTRVLTSTYLAQPSRAIANSREESGKTCGEDFGLC
jgi:UDPglucose 6-dehydrogenase